MISHLTAILGVCCVMLVLYGVMVTIAWQRAAQALLEARAGLARVHGSLQESNGELRLATAALAERDELLTSAKALIEKDKAAIESALEQADAAEKTPAGFFSSIAAIEKERNEAFRLYHVSTAQMAVAQGMMMKEIDRLAKMLGKTPDERIRRYKEAYDAEHAAAIAAGKALMAAEEAAEKAAPPALGSGPDAASG